MSDESTPSDWLEFLALIITLEHVDAFQNYGGDLQAQHEAMIQRQQAFTERMKRNNRIRNYIQHCPYNEPEHDMGATIPWCSLRKDWCQGECMGGIQTDPATDYCCHCLKEDESNGQA